MSWNPLLDAHIPIGDQVDAIETVIVARARDLGGFEVRRALPSARRQMVGPFIFFDQMGPAEFLTGKGVDVRPHPHIGLSTVTYLLSGRMHHRDSLGTDQWIAPGQVNIMQAGNGITHSERMDDPGIFPQKMFGLQTWLALPAGMEDTAPGFTHLTAGQLPVLQAEGKQVRLLLGQAWGASVADQLPMETFYAEARLEPGASLPLPEGVEDRGIYVLQGTVSQGGQDYGSGQMLIFRPGDAVSVRAGDHGALVMALGGATMDGPRFIWWNFVASSKDRIDAAREAWRAGDWAHGRFKLPVGDAEEFIPAPPR